METIGPAYRFSLAPSLALDLSKDSKRNYGDEIGMLIIQVAGQEIILFF